MDMEKARPFGAEAQSHPHKIPENLSGHAAHISRTRMIPRQADSLPSEQPLVLRVMECIPDFIQAHDAEKSTDSGPQNAREHTGTKVAVAGLTTSIFDHTLLFFFQQTLQKVDGVLLQSAELGFALEAFGVDLADGFRA